MSYFGGYFGEEDSTGDETSTPPPTPVPTPVTPSSPLYRDFVKAALARLPMQFRDPDV